MATFKIPGAGVAAFIEPAAFDGMHRHCKKFKRGKRGKMRCAEFKKGRGIPTCKGIKAQNRRVGRGPSGGCGK